MSEYVYVYEEGVGRPSTRTKAEDSAVVKEALGLPQEIKENVSQELTVTVGTTGDYPNLHEVFQDLAYYKGQVIVVVQPDHVETRPVILKNNDFSNFRITKESQTFVGKVINVNNQAIVEDYYGSFPAELDVDGLSSTVNDYSTRPYMILLNATSPWILVNFTGSNYDDSRTVGAFLINSKMTIGDVTNGTLSNNSGFASFGKNNILATWGSTVNLGDSANITGAGSTVSGNGFIGENGGDGVNIALLEGSTLNAGLITGNSVTIESGKEGEILAYGSTVRTSTNIFVTPSATKTAYRANRGSILQLQSTPGSAIIDSSSALFTHQSLLGVTNNGFGNGSV